VLGLRRKVQGQVRVLCWSTGAPGQQPHRLAAGLDGVGEGGRVEGVRGCGRVCDGATRGRSGVRFKAVVRGLCWGGGVGWRPGYQWAAARKGFAAAALYQYQAYIGDASISTWLHVVWWA